MDTTGGLSEIPNYPETSERLQTPQEYWAKMTDKRYMKTLRKDDNDMPGYDTIDFGIKCVGI